MDQSEPIYEVQVDRHVPIPMRDGTLLSADVYRPKAEGKWPVIVSREGYDPSLPGVVASMTFFSQRGYAYVLNNTRGTYQSEGVFFPFIDDGWGENQDGYDTIEWAGRQPWSNGQVGMYGASYDAFTQYLAAPTRPPSLKVCMPIFGTCSPRDFVFPRGIYHMHWHRGWAVFQILDMALHCPRGLGATNEEWTTIIPRLEKAQAELEFWYRQLPLKDFPPLKDLATWYFEHLNHPPGDPWWDQTNGRTKFDEVDVPMLHVAGWYEGNLNAMIETYTGLRTQGRSATCRNGQRLIIGPWVHHDEAVPPPPMDFTRAAIIDFREVALRWFDYWLKAKNNGVPDEPAVRVFLMGENRWLDLEDWPPADIIYTSLYLRQGTGQTEQSLNNGQLTSELPAVDEPPDTYAYDPEDPTLGHSPSDSSGEVYQHDLEGKLLTYTSDILQEAVVVVGPVKAVIYASSSAPDTDWVVRLCNVWPDGRSIKVCDGRLKARYRISFEQEAFMAPGEVYQFEIDMTATAQTFFAGHKIRIQVTSSEFPYFDRNLNTDGAFGEEASSQVAINTIFHDATRPSHVVLPLRS